MRFASGFSLIPNSQMLRGLLQTDRRIASVGTGFRLAIRTFFLATLLTLLTCSVASAQKQAREPEPRQPRIALIIANFDYPGAGDQLSGPAHDADQIAQALKGLGFVGVDGSNRLNPVYNASLQKMKDSVVAFKDRMNAAGELAAGFIYFAGHGASSGNDNYLLPVDVANVSTADVSKQGLGMSWVIDLLKQIHTKNPPLIFVVDACRSASASASKGGNKVSGPQLISPREPPDGMLIAMSAGAGQVATDSGIFADMLAKYIKTPGLKVDDVFNDVKISVANRTKQQQIPFVSSKVTQTICFAGCNVQSSAPDSMSILQNAMRTRPAGDIGQIAAVEDLVTEGKSLAKLDLRAVNLSGAHMDGADLSGSTLSVATLDGASLVKAKVSDTSFYFTRMEGLHAADADMSQSRFFFADATKADFGNIEGELSNWQASTLRGANFRNAKLQSANFMMADVRDADFTGADLRGAFFNAAFIAGAKFDQAKFDNTDFGAAVGSASQFSRAQQAKLCGTSNNGRTAFNYTVRRYDPKADVYGQYKDLFSQWIPLRDGARFLVVCKPRSQIPVDAPPVWNTGKGEALNESFALNVDSEVVDAFGRQAQIVSQGRAMLQLHSQSLSAGNFVIVGGK